jgi:hypothetical protein
MPHKEGNKPPVDDKDVIQKVRWIYEEGTVEITPHFREELRAAGATTLDLEYVLFGACSLRGKHKERGRWRYELEGPDEQGEVLTIVLEIDLRNSAIRLITAY